MEVKTNQNAADIISEGLNSEDLTSEQLQQLSKEIDDTTEKEESQSEEEKNLNNLSLEELIEHLKQIIEKPVPEIRKTVETIRNLYHKKRLDLLEQLRQKFIEEGGDAENFKTPMEVLDLDRQFNNYLEQFREKRDKYDQEQEQIRQNNYQQKLEIIERVKQLIHSTKDFNQVHKEFKQLEKKWREIGQVPQKVYRELMQEWNTVRKQFYDLVKINEELREFDLQKNLEQKRALIERAEALVYEPDPVKAYKELQELHNEWKEIGPVPKEYRESIWEEFRKISHEINKRHQEYYKKLKERQKKNLEAKTRLCEAAEKIADLELTTIKDWQEKTKIILELQQLWRKVGRVPKKYNQSIYERFRKACDKFFERKREFFRQHQELLQENLRKKEELAALAEKLKESTEWGKTAREFERLFEQWKKIGPVPREKSEEVWQRFRTARLEFFRRKRQYIKEMRKQERENLKKKLELIERIKNLELSDNQEENIKLLQEIEKEWASIGFVPFKEKDRVNKMYREAIDEKFGKVNLDADSRRKLQFEQRLKAILESSNPKRLLAREIEKYRGQLSKLKSDVLKLENNLEMFKDSPEEFLKEFKDKLENLRDKMKTIEGYIERLVKEYKKLG